MPDLLGGVKPIMVMIGLFAVAELMRQSGGADLASQAAVSVRIVFPSFPMMRRLAKPQGIGCGVGLIEGLLPGGGGSVAAFFSYNEAKRWSKHPEEFGRGSPEGIAAPEAANNVVTATALVPLLSLGIPGSNSAAVLLGGFLVHGLQPGPMLFEKAPDVVNGLYWGLLFANAAMFLLGLVILTPAIWLVNRPKPYLLAAILALVVSGVFAIEQSLFDVGLVLAAGVMGYGLRLAGVPMLPMVLGVVLGFMLESNFRRSLVLSGDDPMIFLQDPISLVLLLLAAGMTAWSLWREFAPNRTRDA
jgi:putative tricarboxylic transport membrane protein